MPNGNTRMHNVCTKRQGCWRRSKVRRVGVEARVQLVLLVYSSCCLCTARTHELVHICFYRSAQAHLFRSARVWVILEGGKDRGARYTGGRGLAQKTFAGRGYSRRSWGEGLARAPALGSCVHSLPGDECPCDTVSASSARAGAGDSGGGRGGVFRRGCCQRLGVLCLQAPGAWDVLARRRWRTLTGCTCLLLLCLPSRPATFVSLSALASLFVLPSHLPHCPCISFSASFFRDVLSP